MRNSKITQATPKDTENIGFNNIEQGNWKSNYQNEQ